MKNTQQIIAIFYGLCLTMLLQACPSEHNPSQRPRIYFDVADLVDSLSRQLAQQPCTLTKTVIIQQKQEQKQFQSHEIAWQKELQLFAEASINKPSLVGKYQLQTHPDTLLYTAQDSGLSVKKLLVIFQQQQLQSVTIEYHNHHFFYDTRRWLQLNFSQQRLASYHIKGTQKNKMLAPHTFEVSGKIDYLQ